VLNLVRDAFSNNQFGNESLHKSGNNNGVNVKICHIEKTDCQNNNVPTSSHLLICVDIS
jgi:hypothetical protein